MADIQQQNSDRVYESDTRTAGAIRIGTSLCVHYGCGWCAPEGWRNFDASPTLRLERIPVFGRLIRKNPAPFPRNVEYGDIVKGLPLPDCSCDAVYCSHVLEHLSLEECRIALQNTYRILKPGGIFRMVLPDLEYEARRYLETSSPTAALEFMKRTGLGWERRARGLWAFLRDWLGNSRHMWMWDYTSLSLELERVGFHNIRRARIGDSSLAEFSALEDAERWANSLGIECIR